VNESELPAVNPELQRTVLALAVRVTLLALLAYWCFRILQPFVVVVVWGVILAVAFDPLISRTARAIGGKRKLAAALLVLLGLLALVVPAVALSGSLTDEIHALTSVVESGSMEIPPPPAKVADWPLVGDRVFATWSLASQDVDAVLQRYGPQIKALAARMVGLLRGVVGAVVMTVFAVVVGVYLQVRREWAVQTALRTGRFLGGERGMEAVKMVGGAISTGAKGVIGVAVVQAILAAIGLFLAGVPLAGLWSLLVLILAVAQLPPLLVLAPAMLYVISSGDSTLGIVAFVVWSLLVSISDAALKPLFMGRGTELPVPVILVGAIGGLMLHGLIGLFVGAVVFSTGYRLLTRPPWGSDGESAIGGPGTVIAQESEIG